MFRNIFTILLFGFVVLFEFFSTCHQLSAQNITKYNSDSVQEIQILEKARSAIKLENKRISSIYIKYNRIPTDGTESNNTLEVSLMKPDKIKFVSSYNILDAPQKNIITWNGKNYQRLSESEIGGQKIVRKISEPKMDNRILERLEGKISKEDLEKYKKTRMLDPNETLNNQTWSEIFPFVLENPFEENLQYKYVGKAEAKNRFVNIIDVRSKYDRNYRLMFDSETNYLVLMIVSFTGFDGDYEDKYYYSNRQDADNILVPKTIKVERKFTPTGKAPNISYENIEIVDFKLNPDFKESMFEIK